MSGEVWRIERLGRSHGRGFFRCGNEMLDEWLKRRAGQWGRSELTRTYVGVRDGETRVLGYYAISSHHVSFQNLPHHEARHLPEIDVPVVLLGRLAVDESAQGHGLGRLLLLDALRRAQHLATELGIRAVEVDAIDQDARRFYLRFGFTPLTDDPKHLFLPMLVIRKLGLPPLHRP